MTLKRGITLTALGLVPLLLSGCLSGGGGG